MKNLLTLRKFLKMSECFCCYFNSAFRQNCSIPTDAVITDLTFGELLHEATDKLTSKSLYTNYSIYEAKIAFIKWFNEQYRSTKTPCFNNKAFSQMLLDDYILHFLQYKKQAYTAEQIHKIFINISKTDILNSLRRLAEKD